MAAKFQASASRADTRLRPDIQFLRGFAVLAVLFYHANVIPVAGGYLGVDIFFVVSGYLITSIVLRDIDRGVFTFSGFYIRRAKRLLPAAYCTIIFTSLLGYLFLTDSQWNDYVKQLVGAVTFTANLIIAFQTGYFESAAEGKPLLHTWSLSVEEQYYLLIPLLAYLASPKLRGWMFLVFAAVSLTACVILVSFPFTYWRLPTISSQVFGFFSLPARAWELLAGSLLAWNGGKIGLPIPNPYKLSVFIILAGVICFPLDDVHPRGDALVVVMATIILLAGGGAWLPSNALTRYVARVGDFSYSLYLVHWPLFAFAHNAYLGRVPDLIKFALMLGAIALGYFQYQLVEQRFRYAWQAGEWSAARWLIVASIIAIVVPMPIMLVKSEQLPKPYLGLSEVCALGKGSVGTELFEHPELCSTGKNPAFAIWGDSYAMHLVPGLRKDPRIGNSMIQLTKSACAPIVGLASIDGNYNAQWASGCLKFNDEVLDYLNTHDSIKYIVLSSPFGGYFDEGVLPLFHQGKSILSDRSIAIEQFILTIGKLRAMGKIPIVVSPPPAAGFNIAECWERIRSRLSVLGRSDCNIMAEELRAYQGGITSALKDVQRYTGVEIVWISEILCKESYCLTAIDYTPLYRDGGHLSEFGSTWIMQQISLADRIMRIRSD